MYGINISGGEFGGAGTRYDVDYHYPTATELAYYANSGVQLIRLPIKWERLESTLGGPLSTTELARINNVLANAHALGMDVIIDVHNYGRYAGSTIGSTAVPASQFADFWGKMATALHGTPGLAGYDLMNEPHDMGGAGIWKAAAQGAVDAIRSVDMATPLYVEGEGWSSAQSWAKVNGDFILNDPAAKLIYEAHVYFDKSNQGVYANSYDADGTTPNIGVDRLQPFADWLAAHQLTGFIGEFGAPSSDPRWLTVVDNFLRAMEAHGISGTAWGGGFWWNSTYNLRLGGGSTGDSAQFNVLKPHFAHTGVIAGTAGDDQIVGTAAIDRIDAGSGNDLIFGSLGGDTIAGGRGNDTVNYGGSTASVDVDLNRTWQRGGFAEGDMLGSIENVFGSDYADLLRGNALANILAGNGGDDRLIGGAGSDRLDGGAGIDTADYSASTAKIDIDFGRASQLGGDAAGDVLLSIERVLGTAYADKLAGGSGADSLIGNAGNDTLQGRAGTDSLDGGAGRDLASYAGSSAGVDVDLLRDIQLGGDAAGDRLVRIEDLLGSSFDDRLVGDGLANWLSGGAGNDILIGGGSDKLTGGSGNDRFQFASTADAKGDKITDFTLGDLIDLGSIDANAVLPGDQAFTSIGSKLFDGAAGELRYFQDAGHSLTYIQGDINGDKIADFTISLDGLHALSAASFVM